LKQWNHRQTVNPSTDQCLYRFLIGRYGCERPHRVGGAISPKHL